MNDFINLIHYKVDIFLRNECRATPLMKKHMQKGAFFYHVDQALFLMLFFEYIHNNFYSAGEEIGIILFHNGLLELFH